MNTANDLYQNIMSFLREMDTQSKFTHFMQTQVLSAMRGVQISDENKIKSILIFFNAAAQYAATHETPDKDKLNECLINIKEDANMNENDSARMTNSLDYIVGIFDRQENKVELKEKYQGKPWQLESKNSPSSRMLEGLKKPESNILGSGLIPTKNGKGWEFPPIKSDIFAKQFQDTVAAGPKKRVLILGAAYGEFVYQLLEYSEQYRSKMIVNDLSPDHLGIFKDNLNTKYDNLVSVISGDFVNDIDFPDNHFDLILLQNVMHFFTPEQVDQCLNRIYGWLKPGGQFTVTTSTPYMRVFQGDNNHIDIFEQKKKGADEWPGFINNLKDFLEQQNHPAAKIASNEPLHNFDIDTLQTVLLKHGYKIKGIGFFAMPNNFPPAFLLDGREYVGAEAYKPKK